MVRAAFENTRLNIEQSCAVKLKKMEKIWTFIVRIDKEKSIVRLADGECAPDVISPIFCMMTSAAAATTPTVFLYDFLQTLERIFLEYISVAMI